MIQRFYTSSNTMINQQKKINMISGNIANVNTDGYKQTSVDFSQVLYSQFWDNPSEGLEEQYGIGNGIYANQISKDFSQGMLELTNNALDLSILGEGFFTLSDGQDGLLYTRGGSFQLSAEADGTYIVSGEGYYLLDADHNRVNVDGGDYTIDESGAVTVGDQTVAQLEIVRFAYPQNLDMVGGSLYRHTSGAGMETEDGAGRIKQGAVEKSNVDLSGEMVDLIETQRIYQMNSKMVQIIDEMQGMANRLRK